MRTVSPEPLIGPPPGPRPRWLARSAAMLALLLLAAGFVVLPQDAPLAAPETPFVDEGPFPIVGSFDPRNPDGSHPGRPYPVGTDPELGLFILASEYAPPGVNSNGARAGVYVYLVDTTTLEQVAVIDVPLPWGDQTGASDPTTTTHPKSKVLYGLDPNGHRLFLAQTDQSSGIRVAVVSLTGAHEPAITWIPASAFVPGAGLLASEAAQVVNANGPLGYNPADDSLLIATQGISVFENWYVAATPLRIHELSVPGLLEAAGNTSRLEVTEGYQSLFGVPQASDIVNWTYEVPVGWCTHMVMRYGRGVLRRSVRDPDQITAVCGGNPSGLTDIAADFIAVGSVGYRDGFLHIDLRGERGASANPTRFVAEFAEAPAKLDFASASPDPANDLVVVGAAPFKKQKLFVYDALERAFRGNVPIEVTTSPAIDPWSGMLYQPAGQGRIQTVDTSRLAVPTGDAWETQMSRYNAIGTTPNLGTTLLVDPATRRVLIPEARLCVERDPATGGWRREGGYCQPEEPPSSRGAIAFAVVEDRRPPPDPGTIDWDAATQDVAEQPGVTNSEFSATAKGFGARYTFVGGVSGSGGAWLAFADTPAAKMGTNDVILARARGAGLTGGTYFGAQVGADAVGVALDDDTATTLADATTVAVPDPGPVLVEGRAWPEDYPDELRGKPSSCRDFATSPGDDAHPGSSVACDAGATEASAAAVYAADRDAGSESAAAPLIHVGDSEVVSTVRRDPEFGTVAQAVAVVRDVELLGGAIRIGEARTIAQAAAHGRPGTAATSLTREFHEVAVGPPGEPPAFTCGLHDPCDALEVVRAVNRILQPRVTASIPPQDVSLAGAEEATDAISNGTPGGARAAVQRDLYDEQSDVADANFEQSELAAIVFTITNNTNATSRHVVQLAGVTLDAQYRVTALPTYDPPPTGSAPGPSPTATPSPPIDDGLLDGVLSPRQVQPPTLPLTGLEDASAVDPPAPTGGQTPTSPPPGSSATPPLAPLSAPPSGVPPLGVDFAPAPTGDVAIDEGGPAPQVASPPVGEPGTPPVAVAGEHRVARQRGADGGPLAALTAMALLPGYLASRRRSVRD